MHAMDTSQGSSRISGEISTLKDLIVALSHQVAQLTSELTANRNELTATKSELLINKNDAQGSNVQVSASASPPYAAIARTSPTSQPSNLPSFSSKSLTPSNIGW